MEINAANRRTYELTGNGRFLGALKYKNEISYKARIKLSNPDYHEI